MTRLPFCLASPLPWNLSQQHHWQTLGAMDTGSRGLSESRGTHRVLIEQHPQCPNETGPRIGFSLLAWQKLLGSSVLSVRDETDVERTEEAKSPVNSPCRLRRHHHIHAMGERAIPLRLIERPLPIVELELKGADFDFRLRVTRPQHVPSGVHLGHKSALKKLSKPVPKRATGNAAPMLTVWSFSSTAYVSARRALLPQSLRRGTTSKLSVQPMFCQYGEPTDSPHRQE